MGYFRVQAHAKYFPIVLKVLEHAPTVHQPHQQGDDKQSLPVVVPQRPVSVVAAAAAANGTYADHLANIGASGATSTAVISIGGLVGAGLLCMLLL